MDELFSRNELYWGKGAQEGLKLRHVLIFGLGGVGGYCAEMLARAGVGKLTIVDFDVVSKSNINRQIIALNSTVGKKKTELWVERLKDINPQIEVVAVDDFYTNKLNDFIVGGGEAAEACKFDFVVDGIDTLRSKISLLSCCHKNNIPIISSFGAGNRIDPTQLYICDISEIENKKDIFVSNILYQLRKKGIKQGLSVVVSRENPQSQEKIALVESVQTKLGEKIEFSKITPSSTPFVASTAGIFMASFVVQRLI